MDQAKLNLPFEWKRTMIIFVEQLIVCQSKTDINFALKSLDFLLFHGGAMRLHSYRSHTALLANTSPVYINASCNHFSTLLLRLVSSTPFLFIYQFCARMTVLTESTFGNPAEPRGVRQHCCTKKAATVGRNGRLSALCNFFSL